MKLGRGRSQTTFTRQVVLKYPIVVKAYTIENISAGGVGGKKKPKSCQRSF